MTKDDNSTDARGIMVYDLTKRFDKQTALQHVTVNFEPGRIHGLLGRNGAGKTTLMSIICNHSFASSGNVYIDGQNPAENANILSTTCFVHENQRWHDVYTAGMILRSAQRFYPDWDVLLCQRLVRRLDLPLTVRAGKLSRGQRSALAVTIALSSGAPYTFLDEPYLGMDATARGVLYEELAVTQAENPRTFLMSSHLIDECANLLEKVTILHHGCVVEAADVDEATTNSWVFTGPTELAEHHLREMEILSTSTMGAVSSMVFRGQLDEDRRHILQAVSMAELRHATLQELVSAVGAVETENNVQHDAQELLGGSR
ncbi:ATP-binding cassette domain-containing protein [Bifidobacterium sp.]|jgi:ABC-2 type transport system ATP-binding protein|uniref:ATP-binding cassette domain-containing protein n=1 Tax=Bifidobacterium sp. TaxID=41200 RepID=UPI0025BE2740|nr:ABC transporter ATP-binding protein [Bifidobacterium sp.]MCI1635086.1 ABC transporter ATP-binding protein [Bifidobacterium sp.]